MLDETLVYRLLKVVKTYRFRIAAGLAPLGLHPGQEFLLNQLWGEDGLTQSELIARLGVEPPTVTKTLQRLERAGIVTRTQEQRTRVHLTEQGKALREPVEAVWREADEDLRAGLSDEDRKVLDRLLEAT